MLPIHTCLYYIYSNNIEALIARLFGRLLCEWPLVELNRNAIIIIMCH